MDKQAIGEFISMKTVLLVDDDEEIIVALESLLKRRFKEVYVGRSGLEGIKVYNEKKPDIIISDITMPQMSGIEMAEKIMEENKDVKVVFITGHSEEKYTKKIAQMGQSYILKPADLTTILEQSAKILS